MRREAVASKSRSRPVSTPRRPRAPRFDAAAALAQIDELVRLTTPPAGLREICEQGLAVVARALSAAGALLLLRDPADGTISCTARWGRPGPDLVLSGEAAVRTGRPAAATRRVGGAPVRVVLLIPGDTAPTGAVALDRPGRWSEGARRFAHGAVRVLAAAIRTARSTLDSRAQRELLTQRNLELEALADLAVRLQELDRDEEMLQAALDLLLDKLGLSAGWVLVGEKSRASLELVASRGIRAAPGHDPHDAFAGECLCRDVFETGRLRTARNTVDCPRIGALGIDGGASSHACVPLKFERGVLGVMNIVHPPRRPFSEQELRFLETAGKQICMAVDRARTSRAERRRNAEARALAALARAIGGSLDLEKVLGVVGDYARELLGASFCAVLLADLPGRFRLAHLVGAASPLLAVGEPVWLDAMGLGAASEVLRAGLVFTLEDATSDPRIDGEAARRHGIGSALVVPLRAQGQGRGLLVAARSRPYEWNLEQLELADALGRQAALAIENARLFGEARASLETLRQAQDAMMRAERLAAVGTVAASLAHEVRNPLNSINLQLVLLERRLAGLPDIDRAEMVGYLETARGEINRLDGLVQESLTLSTIDRLALVHGDPVETVREVLSLMAPMAHERGVEIREDFPEAAPSVAMDPEKLKQVLINLVRNAIEAMPEGGLLGVSSRIENGALVIRIADTGAGIEDGLDVFDLFVTTKQDGTGLGLPIARRIVEAHGGSLTYESAPGRGTTFTIALKVPEWKATTEKS